MALTDTQIAQLVQITRKTRATVEAKASSLTAEDESLIADDIDLWDENKDDVDVELRSSNGADYRVQRLLDAIRLRILVLLGFSIGGVGVYAGGISQADKDARAADTDRIAPSFTSDLHQTSSGNSLLR